METLQDRMKMAFNLLIERGIVLVKYNTNVFSTISHVNQLQLCTNLLSAKDLRIILSICDLFSLDVSIIDFLSLSGNRLTIIFKDKNL